MSWENKRVVQKRVVAMEIKLRALERFSEGVITAAIYEKKMTWKSNRQTHTHKKALRSKTRV